MVVITRDKVKELLGITSTDFDVKIDAKIPYIDAKVKQITNNNYDFKFVGAPVLDSNKMFVYEYLPDDYNGGQYSGINNYNIKSDISKSLEIGQLITGEGIPADTYIQNIVKQGSTTNDAVTVEGYVYIEMSAVATVSADSTEITGGISIGYQDIIAKGVQYLINGTSTTLPGRSLASKSFGPVSKSFSASDEKIDGKSGMPSWFVKGLPSFASGY